MSKLRGAGAVAIAMSMFALVACGNNNAGSGNVDADGTADSSETTTADSSETTTADFSGITLSYFGFGGVLDEQIQKTWMKPFTDETGAEFILDSPTDYSKIQLQVESGNVSYDIIDGDQFFINPQCGVLFEQLEVDQSSVLPEFQSKSDCGVTDYVYGIGYYYDKSKFPNGGPLNCDDFFNTDKFPGKRAIWSYVAAAGALECAAIASGADPMNPYPLDLDKAFAKLESIKSSLTTFDSGSQVVDGMVNGDIPIVMATTRNYVDAVNKGADYGVATGFAGRGAGAFAVPKGAPNRDAAIAWLRSIMDIDLNREITKGAPPFSSAMGGEVPDSWPQAAKDVGVVSGGLADVAWDVDQQWWEQNYDGASERYSALLTG